MNNIWHVKIIDQHLPDTPYIREGGSLLVMVGLPGTGKSVLVDTLVRKVPAVIIRTDAVRRLMRSDPRYTASEMVWVYEVCQRIIEMRLRKGQRVIFDGTNYQAARRDRLFNVARRLEAVITVAHVQATEKIIAQRLHDRNSDKRREGDLSDADLSVYQWMVNAQEPIEGPHIVMDTSQTPAAILAERLRKYWFDREKHHTTTGFLTSPWTKPLS